MTDLRKATEMALEAMQSVIDCRPIGYETIAMTREQRLREKDQLEIDTYKALRQTQDAIQSLRQALAQEQEPVAWMDKDGDVLSASVVDGKGLRNIPLYTAPPKRKWVGLEEESLSMVTDEFYAGAVWAEAKLKEKNT